jgi:uncharacterized protein with von Willebrand factor type A (vWA) domain
LRRSCTRLTWLNPLPRYVGFKPKELGIRTILRHVDDMRPMHYLESMETLCRALAVGTEPHVKRVFPQPDNGV